MTQDPADFVWTGASRSSRHDPNADYGALWVAVHDYIVCQARVGLGDDQAALALGRAYDELVRMHNLIHERYVAEQEAPRQVAGR